MLNRNIIREAIGTGIYNQDCEIPRIGNSVFQISTTTSDDQKKISAKNSRDSRFIVIDIMFFNLFESLSYMKDITICPLL